MNKTISLTTKKLPKNLQTSSIEMKTKLFQSRNLLLITVIAGAFITAANQAVLITALPHLINYFSIDASTAQWLTTAYMLVNGIVIPLTAAILEKISTKKIFLASLGIFAFATALCAVSTNFYLLLIGRIGQAIGAGILMPLSNTVLLLMFPKERRGFAMGIYGLIISFAPAIAPTTAGLVIDLLDWHWLFVGLIPIIVIIMLGGVFFLKDVVPAGDASIDIGSIIFSTLGFGALLYGFSSVSNLGWTDTTVIASIMVGIVFSTLFVLRQLMMKHSMLELRVFRSPTFSLTTLIGGILLIVQVGSAVIVPIFIQNILGKSAFQSGLVLLPGALFMAIGSIFSGRLYDRIGARILVFIGITLLIISTIPFIRLSLDTSLTSISVCYALRYLSIALTLMPLQTAGMNSLPQEMIPHATAVVNTVRQIFGAIGTAILVSIMTIVTNWGTAEVEVADSNTIEVLEATIRGINFAFLAGLIITIVALLLGLRVKERR